MTEDQARSRLLDLAWGLDSPSPEIPQELLRERAELLAPFLGAGARLTVYAGSPTGHLRGGLRFPHTGMDVEVAAADAPTAYPVQVGPATLAAIVADRCLMIVPKEA